MKNANKTNDHIYRSQHRPIATRPFFSKPLYEYNYLYDDHTKNWTIYILMFSHVNMAATYKCVQNEASFKKKEGRKCFI